MLAKPDLYAVSCIYAMSLIVVKDNPAELEKIAQAKMHLGDLPLKEESCFEVPLGKYRLDVFTNRSFQIRH